MLWRRAAGPGSSDQLTQEITQIVSSSRGTTTCNVTIQDAQLTHVDQACEEGQVFVQATKVPWSSLNAAESSGFHSAPAGTVARRL
ncbi:MAG: hypothetical protein OXR73_22860, partial [Myxococcales bacterium]|nr:hypothetical protein [Myxococcales bacterium]